MPEADWNALGQGLAAFIVAVLTGIGIAKGKGKTASPPEDRAPATHEVKQALYDLHSKVERSGMDEEAAASLKRSIDMLASALDRNTTACNGISAHMATVNRAIEELAKEMEFSSRMGRRT